MRRPSPYWCSTSVCGATVFNVIAHMQTVTYISESGLLMCFYWWEEIQQKWSVWRTGNRREERPPQQHVHSSARGHRYPEVLFCLYLFFFLSTVVCMSISMYSWMHLANDWHRVLSSTLFTLFSDSISCSTWSSPIQLDWLAGKCWGVCFCGRLFKWVLGIWAQVNMLVQWTFNWLSGLLSPGLFR